MGKGKKEKEQKQAAKAAAFSSAVAEAIASEKAAAAAEKSAAIVSAWDTAFGHMSSWKTLDQAKAGTSNFPQRESYLLQHDWNTESHEAWVEKLEKFKAWAIKVGWEAPIKAGFPGLDSTEKPIENERMFDKVPFNVVETWGKASCNGYTVGVSAAGKLGLRAYLAGDRVAKVTWTEKTLPAANAVEDAQVIEITEPKKEEKAKA